MNKIMIEDDIRRIVKEQWEKVNTHDNDIRRLADAIIQLQAKVNTLEYKVNNDVEDGIWRIDRKVQNIEERVRNIEKLTDDIDTHGRIIRKLTDDVIRIEDMVSEAKERIGDLEDTVESMGERIDCMENDMEYVKDNMMEGEDTYNPPDDYMF